MLIKNTIEEALQSLYVSKQRTILALIGIIIGIGSVIAMISIGQIVQKEALKQFKELGTDILTIQKEAAEPGAKGGQSVSIIKLKDALALPTYCSTISSVAPYIGASRVSSYGGKIFESTSLYGVTQSFAEIHKLRIIEGRFLSDIDEMSHFCVVGAQISNKMKEWGAKKVVGERLKIGGRLFTIIGVLGDTPTGGMRMFNANESIIIHITTAMRINTGNEITIMSARVKPGIVNVAAQAQVTEYFQKRIKIKGIRVISPEEMIAAMEKQMQMFTLLLGSIGSIALIVGGVGVMNVMLVSVSERRKEIGIRRAFGARRKDIRRQFLIESLLLSLIGGIFGISLGVLASYIISVFANWGFIISYSAIIIGFGVSSAVGIFFGYYPASQAAKLDPIIALRSN